MPGLVDDVPRNRGLSPETGKRHPDGSGSPPASFRCVPDDTFRRYSGQSVKLTACPYTLMACAQTLRYGVKCDVWGVMVWSVMFGELWCGV